MHIINLADYPEAEPLVREIESSWSAFVETSQTKPATLGAAKSWLLKLHSRLSWFAVGFDFCGDKSVLKQLRVLCDDEFLSYYDWQIKRGQFALEFLDQARHDVLRQLGIEVCDA